MSWFYDNANSEPVTLDISSFNGITPVSYENITGYSFHPGRVSGDGFFIAVLRKRGGEERGRQHGRKRTQRPGSDILKRIEPLIDIDADRLAITGDRVIALAAHADVYNRLSERLRVVKSGTLVGEFRNADFVPAHDLAMSVKQRSGAWPAYNTTYEEAVSFLRLENFPVSGMPKGRIQMHYRGIPLGFIKNLGNRFNNGYPQGWRIRMEKKAGFMDIL
jgi:NOL1/NOP2/fmu family ribosome biogenesis protein